MIWSIFPLFFWPEHSPCQNPVVAADEPVPQIHLPTSLPPLYTWDQLHGRTGDENLCNSTAVYPS